MKTILMIAVALFTTLSGFNAFSYSDIDAPRPPKGRQAVCQVRGSSDKAFYKASNMDPIIALRLAEKACKAAGNYSCYYSGCY